VTTTAVLDHAHEAHRTLVRDGVAADTLATRLPELAPAGRFARRNGTWERLPYPGIAVVAMVDAHEANGPFAAGLGTVAALLAAELDPQRYFLLPADSYHQTMANTFSADRYARYVVDAGLAERYPQMLAEAFAAVDDVDAAAPLVLQPVGLSLWRTCIALLLDVPSARDYERIVGFRDQVYGHPGLAAIGLQRTRPFVGHVTLAYIEADLEPAARQDLLATVTHANEALPYSQWRFHVDLVEPRWYDDLAAFHARDDYPRFRFVRD